MTVKRLRKARLTRVVAKTLCAALMAPQMLAWSVRPAAAQRAERTVIVMDFNNRSGIGGPLLGRRAAAAMSLQLRQSDNWDPVSQSDTDRQIQTSRLHPPFDRVALQTLAHALDANMVLTGDVLSASVSQNPAEARVKIVVRLMDVGSTELVNGAVATGTASHIGLENAQDVLLDEALSKAAFDARQSMERYQLPEGTILNTSVVGTREDAFLNIGTRQGVQNGMRFVVLRGRELVGYLNASSVDADKTVATITQNFRGIKPEDKVRAIYTLPEGADVADTGPIDRSQRNPGDVVSPDVTPKQGTHHRSLTGPVRVFAGILLALGIVAIAGRKSGTTTAFGIQARSAKVAESTDPSSRRRSGLPGTVRTRSHRTRS